MSFASKYYARYNAMPPFIESKPNNELNICVVIPCYNEPNILPTLYSLKQCTLPNCSVEVIVAVNSPENASLETLKQNEITINQIDLFSKQNSTEKLQFFHIHAPLLKRKHAGAGWARKIGMDEALRRFDAINNPTGIIVGFDADSTCQSNYFIELEKHFTKYPECSGVSIYFEHPTEGSDFPQEYYTGIIQYELHLRYLNQAIKYTEFPSTYHTIGSAFAVRALKYMEQGGMNRRTAGEDFYFLQKIISAGHFMNLTTSCVFPSPRPSMRVPFGTGAAITKMIDQNCFQFDTYNFEVFLILKEFFSQIHLLYNSDNYCKLNIHNLLKSFLQINDFENSLKEIRSNSASEASFIKRFYNWFNAFKLIKFLNYTHEENFEKQKIGIATDFLFDALNIDQRSNDLKTKLNIIREYEKQD